MFQICLLIEGIGNMAESLQKNFNPLLLRCLYPVIENAGSSNEFISSTGTLFLINMKYGKDFSLKTI